jgi:sugar phosphate isomerase/epimerase
MKQTLSDIKKIGYDTVQLFGDMELVERCAKSASEQGLEISGILTDLDICQNNRQKLFELCKKYGIFDVGISSVLKECRDIEAYVSRINAFAKETSNAGLTFSYHNHGHEFIKLDDGKSSMEHFFNEFDKTVFFMPDTYWIHDGGCDVRHFLDKTRSRVRILHLKDMKRIETGHTFTEVGNGNLYMKGIIKTALDSGIENFVVEQDICEKAPIESLKTSYKNIKDILEI